MASVDDTLRMAERIADLSKSGTPLPDGLRAAASEAGSWRLGRQFRKLATELESGKNWEEVVLDDSQLPPHLMGLIRAGIRSGDLGNALNGLIDHHRQCRDVWRQLIWSMAYPALTFTFAVALLLFALIFVVPTFEEIFTDFGTELPAATLFWVKISHTFPTLIAGTIVGLVVLLASVRLFGGRVGWSRFVGSIPIFGPMVHWAGIAEMIRLVQIAIAHDTSLPESFKLTTGAVRNANVAMLSNWLADGTERGVSLGKLMEATPRVPAFIVPVIQWGEKKGALVEALGNAHDLLVGRIHMRNSLLSWMLVPIVFVFVAAVVGGITISMFMPLVSLIQNLT